MSKNTSQQPDPGNETPNVRESAPESCCSGIDRRSFFQLAGLTSAAVAAATPVIARPSKPSSTQARRAINDTTWPVLKHYDEDHLAHIALPLGGIGTGAVSLSGNGSLRDWELMSRPAKGFTPTFGRDVDPFFAIYVADGTESVCRVLEGPVSKDTYEGSHGSEAPSVNLPRFRDCEFASAYPFGRVMLSDPDVPVDVDLKAFNPMIPGDADASGIPVAVLTYEIRNKTSRPLRASVCGSIPNFIGVSGWENQRDGRGGYRPVGAIQNRNRFRTGPGVSGIFMDSEGVARAHEAWGTIALATTATGPATHRIDWRDGRWGDEILDFWDDFSADGKLTERPRGGSDLPMASLATAIDLPPNSTREMTFLLAWHFPNRYGWGVDPEKQTPEDEVGNFYCTRWEDAWDVVLKTLPELEDLTGRSVDFVRTLCESSLPEEVKEAALFNTTGLRTQTSFRIRDGHLLGWEGCCDLKGCCHGSCTHVWNYEQATGFLYGSLAMSMRDIEFGYATDDKGLMSFRVGLPLSRAQQFGRVAADGQMGCIMKMYRDWQLSGDDGALKKLWPKVKKAVEFCWIDGGWDGDKDGVMEGVQHNTMDVEYLGPNPQMGFWYLGALRAAEEMARHAGDDGFAATCHSLFERGSRWIDENLFNGEFYEHNVRPIQDLSRIPEFFLIGMGAKKLDSPDYQLANGCLVDQLVGQFMAHVCGLGYLGRRENIARTLESIRKYNHRESFFGHFNPMRSFVVQDEKGLLMADYPRGRPEKPFPYFGEVMTGFEYTAAIGMLQEGMEEDGLSSIRDIRDRYDGRRRSPYDEAECGHHYARAMASWAAILALTGFQYSGVTKTMAFAPKTGIHFWSNGYSWGSCAIGVSDRQAHVRLTVKGGRLPLELFVLTGLGENAFDDGTAINSGEEKEFLIGA